MRAPWRTELREGMDAKTLAETQRLEDHIELTREEASRWLRLGYAITYYSIEGRTIKDRAILLLDTGNHFFTVRKLIVGLSRTPRGNKVKVPMPGQEQIWLADMPAVPDEVDIAAPQEVFEPEAVEEYQG